MAKKAQSPAWPFRIRGVYLVLGLSLLVNAVAVSFIAYIWK